MSTHTHMTRGTSDNGSLECELENWVGAGMRAAGVVKVKFWRTENWAEVPRWLCTMHWQCQHWLRSRILGAEGEGNAEGSGSGGDSAKESTAVSSMDHVNNEVIREPAGAIRNSGEGMQKERIEDNGGGEKESITVVVWWAELPWREEMEWWVLIATYTSARCIPYLYNHISWNIQCSLFPFMYFMSYYRSSMRQAYTNPIFNYCTNDPHDFGEVF